MDIQRRDVRIDACFDIEAHRFKQFVVGGIRFRDGSYEEFPYEREDDMVDALLAVEPETYLDEHGKQRKAKTVDLWSHNGGRYDNLWALQHLYKRDLKCSVAYAGGRVVCVRIGNKRFLDSKAVSKLTLREFTEGLSVAKEHLGFPCERESCHVCSAFGVPCPKHENCDEECEGYCEISREMDRSHWRRVSEYLRADCESLWGAMSRLREYCAQSDLDLGITVGSSAWACARRWLDLGDCELSPSDHRFARRGYFGGRVFVGRQHADRIYECDVNSMYPSRLAQCKIPVGEPIREFGSDAARAFNSGLPGVFRAEVDVPESYIPPLPYRHNGRIYYPTGTFEGVWCAPELHYAESLGVKIQGVYESLTWPDEEIIFDKWVEKLFELRTAAPGGKSGPLGTFLKFFLNSLTGKLGARPDHCRVIVNPDDIRCCPGSGEFEGEFGRVECTDIDCTGFCGAYRPIADDCTPIYEQKGWRLETNSRVEWSGYLTSEARVEWHRQAVSQGDGTDVCYGDTDSLLALIRRLRNMGKKLGLWEDKGERFELEVQAPKVYSYKTEKGERTVKAKGLLLPRDPEKAYRKIKSRQLVGRERPKGFRSAAKAGNFFDTTTIARRPSYGTGDRFVDGDLTRPMRIWEVLRA